MSFSVAAAFLIACCCNTAVLASYPGSSQPYISTRDGHLVLVSGRDRNITLQTSGRGAVNLNGQNLAQIANLAQEASRYVGQLQTGQLSDLQQGLTNLQTAFFGPNGLQGIVQRIETRITNSSGVSEAVTSITRIRSSLQQLQGQINRLRSNLLADQCRSNPCRNGGTCISGVRRFQCLCPPNWQGRTCATDVDECANFAGTDLGCQNRATCVNKPGSYECQCLTGYYGTHCARTTNDCSQASSRELCGEGDCFNKAPEGRDVRAYGCVCYVGYTNDVRTGSCVDVDECASPQPRCSTSPRVECENTPGSFRCGPCPAGYQGNGFYCDDVDECQTYNGGCSMSPFVQCINTKGSSTCASCPPGYVGDGRICTVSSQGACSINNGGCHPLARCYDNAAIGASYVQCNCPPGYEGAGIGPNGCRPSQGVPTPCTPNPCVHGTCQAAGTSFVCACFLGFTGSRCDSSIDSCSNTPCLNGGTCFTTTDGFRCTCPDGFIGNYCERRDIGCGGFRLEEHGTIKFPESGVEQQYQLGMSCAWTIVVDVTKVLNLTFKSFHLEDAVDGTCHFDWLQIHDGMTSGAPSIGKFCGTTLPMNGTVVSTHNSVYLWFRSDNTVNRDGFEVSWNTTTPACGGFVNKSFGFITSPGYPGPYPTHRDCVWTLEVSNFKRIQFQFSQVILENHNDCAHDYLKFFDGDDESFLIAEYCNSSSPQPLLSVGPKVYIRFHSDEEGTSTGFHFTFSEIGGCGGVITGLSGTISSPTAVEQFGTLQCEWQIRLVPGQRVKLVFKQFKLDSSNGCNRNYIEIWEGLNRLNGTTGKLCGNLLPAPYTSTTNIVTVKFHSNYLYSGEKFTIEYNTICGGVFRAPSGNISSPLFPDPYPNRANCIYEIEQPLGKAIELSFSYFDIEEPYVNRRNNCWYDYLEIRDGNSAQSPLIGKYCGRTRPDNVISTYNMMWLKLYTDDTISSGGFLASYSTVNITCGGIIKDIQGTITSPRYPDEYLPGSMCRWIIDCQPGFVVQLTWNSFRLEKNSRNCYFDHVEVYDGLIENDVNRIGRFCGSDLPPILTTTTNFMTIIFRSDDSVHLTGFSAQFQQIDARTLCGGNFYSLIGTISSPNYPSIYGGYKDCTWVITVPNGQQVNLNITDFRLEFHRSCSYDYLEIRNGPSSSSPLIGKYCGTTIPSSIPSHSNSMYLHFVTDGSIHRRGFLIQWDGTTQGCGGNLLASSGSITSPNYPQAHGSNADCRYRITASHGSVIRLIVVDLELEQSSRCRFDYLEIFDGKDKRATSLSKLCGTIDQPQIFNSTSNFMYLRFFSDHSQENKGFLARYSTVCTLELRGFGGVIESPNFPDSYPNALDCKWRIIAARGSTINITFSHFEIRTATSGNTCLNDYLQISEFYDTGEATSSNLTNKLCGYNIPSPVASHHHVVEVKFATGFEYYSANGFRLEWVAVGCGGLLTRPKGYFNSPGYPNGYPESTECHWLITVDYSSSVELTFITTSTESTFHCVFDYITVYGGPDETSPILAQTCHTGENHTITSTGNNMLVKFTSDNSYSGKGFHAEYKSVPTTCGGRFTIPSAQFHSPNYPKVYGPNEDCLWLIQVEDTHRISLSFIELALPSTELSQSCPDSITVYDGETTNDTIVGKYCSSVPISNISITSSTNSLLVRFQSDVSRFAKGFLAKYEIACGGRIVTEDTGTISNEHLNSLHENCTWIISGKSLDDRVTLTVTHMDISPKYVSDCTYAALEVYEGDDETGSLYGKYCGNRVPPTITSVGNSLFVKLVPYLESFRGHFMASYAVESTACGGNFTSEHGSFASPRYPGTYPPNYECTWIISTSPGNQAMISFSSFSIPESEHCNEDYLEIRKDSGIGELVGIFCGSELPTNLTRAHILWVKFRSSTTSVGGSFLAHYSMVHGNTLFGPSGYIGSPLYPRFYVQMDEFTWTVTTQFPSKILITFEEMFIETYSNDECTSSIKIYDGYDETAAVLFSGCGASKPSNLESSSNAVFIKLINTAVRRGSRFLLKWQEIPSVPQFQPTEISCSESIYLQSGSNMSTFTFSSPGYPNNTPTEICEWLIETPMENHVALKFNSLNVQDFISYDNNICWRGVEIYSGRQTTNSWDLLETVCMVNETDRYIHSSRFMKIRLPKIYNRAVAQGFSATVYAACGGSFETTNGVIEIGTQTFTNLPGLTSWLNKCEWNITVRPGRKIFIKFETFNLPNRGETCGNTKYLLIKNGGTRDSPNLGQGRYCGNQKPQNLISTSNKVLIQFIGIPSDQAYFKLTFQENSTFCGGNFRLTDNNNNIDVSSPNYPDVPPPYTECTWIFHSPMGESIQIDFQNIGLKYDVTCRDEYIEIRDGSTENSPIIERICNGIRLPGTIKSSGNMLYVYYMTNLLEPNNGFKAKVKIAVCGGTIMGREGIVTSPSYPHSYSENLNCEWIVKGFAYFALNIEFQDLSLPWNRNCSQDDHVSLSSIFEANNTRYPIGSYCGNSIPPTIQTGSDTLSVKFVSGSNNLDHYKGFKLNFTAVSLISRCGGELRLPSGFIESPGYPTMSNRTRICQWKVIVPKGKRILVTVLDFDLNIRMQYAAAELSFYNSLNFMSHIDTVIFNTTIPAEIRSTDNVMAIGFYTPYTNRHRGFRLQYTSDEPAVCGGLLTELSGNIENTIVNETSSYCEWLIQPVTLTNQTVITVVIMKTSMPSIENCDRDSRYFKFVSDNIQHRSFCLNVTKPTPLSIPAVKATLTALRTEKYNFNFTARYVVSNCGGVLTGPEETITTPRGNDTHCVWQAVYPEGQAIKVQIVSMDLSENCDDEYLIIRNGPHPYSPAFDTKYCGKASQGSFKISSGEHVWIEYHSFKSNGRGATIKLSPIVDGCGGTFHNQRGELNSPGYPQLYPNSAECVWDIIVSEGYKVSFDFIERFKLENSTGCVNDFVEIFNYVGSGAVSLGKYCGANKPPKLVTSGHTAQVVFRSNDKTTGDGFKLSWDVACGGLIVNESSGFIKSPAYPDQYDSYSNCNYSIRYPEHEIKVTFLDFEIERESYGGGCKFDNVSIYRKRNFWTGNKQFMGTYCGKISPQSISAYEEMDIIFQSDSFMQYRGFLIKFEVMTCGGEITQPGLWTVPKNIHNSEYYEMKNCTWLIIAPTNKVVVLRFVEAQLEYEYSCNYGQRLLIYDGQYVDVNKVEGQLCGNLSLNLPTLRSKANQMTISYLSRINSIPANVSAFILFMYSHSVGCGGIINVTSNPVEIRSLDINNDGQYENNLDCHWELYAPIGKVIKVEWTSFDVKSCQNSSNQICNCDFIEFRDGPDQTFDLIDKVCGSSPPNNLQSTSESMWIRFATDAFVTGTGFTLRISAVDSICGPPLLHASSDIKFIISPNYPRNYPENIRCSWKVITEKTVDIHLVDMDIQGGGLEECSNAYLKIIKSESDSYLPTTQKKFIGKKTGDVIVWNGFNNEQEIYMCGTGQSLDFYSDTNTTVTFKASSAVGKGFKLNYVYAGCNRNYSNPYGRIARKGMQGDCTIVITAASNATISLYISSMYGFFKLGADGMSCGDSNKLTVFDGPNVTSPTIVVICNYLYSHALFSNSSAITLEYKGRGNDNYRSGNIDIFYTTTDKGPGCGGTLTSYQGIVTSPMYPSNYQNDTSCEWNIITNQRFSITLSFYTFSMGPSTLCSSNYLEIFSIDSATSERLLRSRYCGGDVPSNLQTFSNNVIIKYTTTRNNVGSGWVIGYTAQ